MNVTDTWLHWSCVVKDDLPVGVLCDGIFGNFPQISGDHKVLKRPRSPTLVVGIYIDNVPESIEILPEDRFLRLSNG